MSEIFDPYVYFYFLKKDMSCSLLFLSMCLAVEGYVFFFFFLGQVSHVMFSVVLIKYMCFVVEGYVLFFLGN